MRRENVNNMPETSRETETVERGRDRQQRDQEHQTSRNVVSAISQLADDNLTLVRNISTGLAVAGVIVIARSIRVITKFQAASEIPVRFIEGNVSLRGKVRSITERGIEVEHVPIYLPIISPLLLKHRDASTSPLLVHLAGVELTPEGKTWLQKNLVPPQTVWLKLISREDDMLHCLVSQSRPPSVCPAGVDVELLHERGAPKARPGPPCSHRGTPAGLSPLLAPAQTAAQGRGEGGEEGSGSMEEGGLVGEGCQSPQRQSVA
ncbi:protein C3orf33 homolog isoform X3 [Poecilia latipinna]|uniref:protein C3orf33 homolog isoform X3 n=1 Tax=Poecilia latipinna TaxID=48699 RepID=UPI00072EC6FD|nr:PREDICTED: protein C3orf33 homolog isoform X3 [Poecilia latipinna]